MVGVWVGGCAMDTEEGNVGTGFRPLPLVKFPESVEWYQFHSW